MEDRWSVFLGRAERLMEQVESLLAERIREPHWEDSIAFRYRRRRSNHAEIVAVPRVHAIELQALKGIDEQRERVRRNTEQFVRGSCANNVLLTGARGTGKSSLVRACLQEFAGQGLRLIEVDKTDLVDLSDIVEVLSQRPERFVIFCDDLSFDEGESDYKALKSVLDGSIAATSENVLVYATSNRRHLMPEYMADNHSSIPSPQGEVHPGEAVEEKVSLSERFGLWVSFYPFSQDEYLRIVMQWLQALNVPNDQWDVARPKALIWALERGSRSGRVAMQFARDFAGQQRVA